LTCKIEFPDFNLDVAIPESFIDISFRNDMCPIFEDKKAGLQLMIDYKDVDLREFEEGPRFILQVIQSDIFKPFKSILETDTFEEVLSAIETHRHFLGTE